MNTTAQITTHNAITLTSLALGLGAAMVAGLAVLNSSVLDLAAGVIVAVVAIVVVVVVSHMSGAPV